MCLFVPKPKSNKVLEIRELGNVTEWLKANKLSLNIEKNQTLSLSPLAKEYALHT